MTKLDTSQWHALGHARNAVLDRLIELGLPEEKRSEAADLIWTIAGWQGAREWKNSRLKLADEIVAATLSEEPAR